MLQLSRPDALASRSCRRPDELKMLKESRILCNRDGRLIFLLAQSASKVQKLTCGHGCSAYLSLKEPSRFQLTESTTSAPASRPSATMST